MPRVVPITGFQPRPLGLHHPTAPLTERVAFDDTVLPLSQPLTLSAGHIITELPIQKGQIIYLGLGACNRNPHVWGMDASVFNPKQWLSGRYHSVNLPGIGPYSNLCVYFFAVLSPCLTGLFASILEMQIVLFELLSKFQFSFNHEQEKNLTSSFALTLLPLNSSDEKPELSVLVQPTQVF
ncbi:hypothetical protein L218DRAFT_1056517 [Marasmius fiardii PR-910]|nr:hypothetical protein L218DRAFT_1056517 [Marasmius fiardii PR-910]